MRMEYYSWIFQLDDCEKNYCLIHFSYFPSSQFVVKTKEKFKEITVTEILGKNRICSKYLSTYYNNITYISLLYKLGVHIWNMYY